MNVPQTPPVHLGGGHCCVCSNENGGICGHIGGPFICARHRLPGNPLVTAENPLGKWNLPFEASPDPLASVDILTLVVDSLDVLAAVTDTPLGRLPVIVFDFHSSALPPDSQPPRLTFIGTADVLMDICELVVNAVNAATAATSGDSDANDG